MKTRVSILVIIYVLGAFGCSKKQDPGSPADFDMAVYDKASVDHLKRLINRRPENSNNYIRLADVYESSGEISLARHTIEEAIKENPEDPILQILLVKYYLTAGETAKAEEYFYKITDQEENIAYGIVQAELLINKGFYDKALQILNKSLSKDPGNAELHYLKGQLYRNIADTTSALSSFKTAIGRENVSFYMVKDYLRVLADLGRTEEFLESYKELTPELRKIPDTKIILSDVLVGLNELDSAKEILFNIDDRQYQGLRDYKLALINFNQRRYDSARYYAEKAFASGKDLQAKLVVARSYEMMYNYQESEDTYLDILERDSTFTIAAEELEKLRRKVRYLRELRRREEQKFQFAPLKPITPEN